MLINILRLSLLALSLYGYIIYFSQWIAPEFSVGFTFAGIGTVMFISGILNILPETSIIIFIGGFVFAIISLYLKYSIRKTISFGTIYFLILCLGFLLLLYKDRFLHYDNFSHWALAVKTILNKNSFPNFQDSSIVFKSYQLGYASFIYYISHIIGVKSEWLQMWAQAIFISGMIVCIFPFCKSVYSKALSIITSLFLLCGNTNLSDLLVDTLLPITSLGLFCLCIFYQDRLFEKRWFIIPWIIYLITIKNSGIFFIVIIIAIISTSESKKRFYLSGMSLSGVLLTFLLWIKHIELAYGESSLKAKHSMTLENFQSIAGEKTLDDISQILHALIERFFSFSNGIIYFLIMSVILFSVFVILKNGVNRKHVIKFFYIGSISYFLYSLGLFGMYILSMPLNEALMLGGFDRYHATILIFVYGILLLESVIITDNIIVKADRQKLNSIVLCILCIISMFFGLRPRLEYLKKQDLNNTLRDEFDIIISDYSVPIGRSYLVVEKPGYTDTGYLVFMARYLLNSPSVTVIPVDKMANSKDDWYRYDFLLVAEECDEIDAYIKKFFNNTGRVIDLSGYKN